MQQVHTNLFVCDCRFFEDYKKNENKEVKIDDFLNNVEAKKAIKESMVSRCQLLMLCHGHTVSWTHCVVDTLCVTHAFNIGSVLPARQLENVMFLPAGYLH